jgi:predicted RecA/RadA family phage recombinase
MLNWISEGNNIEITAVANINSGDVIVVGGLVGVAVTSASAGDQVAIRITGVVSLPITAGTAIPQGTLVYWDATNNVVSTSGTVQLGYTFNDVAATDTTALVKLWAA